MTKENKENLIKLTVGEIVEHIAETFLKAPPSKNGRWIVHVIQGEILLDPNISGEHYGIILGHFNRSDQLYGVRCLLWNRLADNVAKHRKEINL